jgi:hypothetical protein
MQLPEFAKRQDVKIIALTPGAQDPKTLQRQPPSRTVLWQGKASVQPKSGGTLTAQGGIVLGLPDAIALLPPEALTSSSGWILECQGVDYEPNAPAVQPGGCGTFWQVPLRYPR